MTSSEVCENDEFELDIPSAAVKHKPNYKNRGKIIGAYAIIKPKDCDYPTIEWAEFNIYFRGGRDKKNVWDSHPAEMIKKVAETHALKKAFGITGLQSEYDFQVKGDIVIPVVEEVNELEYAQKKIISALDDYKGNDKETIREICIAKRQAGEFTTEFAKDVASKIGLTL